MTVSISIEYKPTHQNLRALVVLVDELADSISEEHGIDYDPFEDSSEDFMEKFGVEIHDNGMSGEMIGATLHLDIEGMIEKIGTDEIRVTVSKRRIEEEINIPTENIQDISISGNFPKRKKSTGKSKLKRKRR